MNLSSIEIRPVQSADVVATFDFVMRARAQIFPMLDSAVVPADLAAFEAVYRQAVDGQFLIASHAGQVIGAIGYLPYDHRFAQLDYQRHRTVEVVRLFVEPAFRGAGLAGRLFGALREHAEAQGVEMLYLHTHPFLPGAIAFWEKQGFGVVDIESDPVWQTTHMDLLLKT